MLKKIPKILVVMCLFLLLGFQLTAAEKIDLNMATMEQLTSVKGIGPKKAQAIIDYRKKSGKFKSVSDLVNVKGFGTKSVQALSESLIVNQPKKSKKTKMDKKMDDKM